MPSTDPSPHLQGEWALKEHVIRGLRLRVAARAPRLRAGTTTPSDHLRRHPLPSSPISHPLQRHRHLQHRLQRRRSSLSPCSATSNSAPPQHHASVQHPPQHRATNSAPPRTSNASPCPRPGNTSIGARSRTSNTDTGSRASNTNANTCSCPGPAPPSPTPTPPTPPPVPPTSSLPPTPSPAPPTSSLPTPPPIPTQLHLGTKPAAPTTPSEHLRRHLFTARSHLHRSKPIPARRPLIPGHGLGNKVPGASLQELVDVPITFYGGQVSEDSVGHEAGSSSLTPSQPNFHMQNLRNREPAVRQFCSNNVGPGRPSFSNLTDGRTLRPYPSHLNFSNVPISSNLAEHSALLTAENSGRCHGWMDAEALTSARSHMLLNRMYLLSSSSCNRVDSIHQAPYQNGYPISHLPNLNCLPERMTNTVVTDFMPIPLTLEDGKRTVDCLPREVIDLVDDSVPEKGMEVIAQPSQVKDHSGEVQSQQQQGETRVLSPEGPPFQRLEIEDQDDIDNQGIDLNKTPQQKPRRKKHRPKVIREGKAASRTPKPVTPKPVTPKPPGSNEPSTGKRKYVRKKKYQESADTQSCVLGEVVDPSSGGRKRSVRRSLNFDSEAAPSTDGGLGLNSMPSCNPVPTTSQAQGWKDIYTSFSSNPYQQHAERLEVVVENSAATIPFDLNYATNPLSNEHMKVADKPVPPNCCIETASLQEMQDGSTGTAEHPNLPFNSARREMIRENLSSNARKDSKLSNSEDIGSSFSPVLLGGKRDHFPVNDAQVPAYIDDMPNFNTSEQLRESEPSSYGPYIMESMKRRRTEVQNKLESGAASSVNSFPVICSPSRSWNFHHVSTDDSAEFTFADAQRLMLLEKIRASEFMLAFGQIESKTTTSPLSSRTCASTADFNQQAAPEKSYISNGMESKKPAPPKKPSRPRNKKGSTTSEPSLSIEDLDAGRNAERRRKKRTKKEQVDLANSVSTITNLVDFQNQEAASYNTVSSLGQHCLEATALKPGNKHIHGHYNSYIQDSQSSSNIQNSFRSILPSQGVVPYTNPVDDIIRKLKCLDINRVCEGIVAEAHNALVPYGVGSNKLVPYEGPFDLTKKRRPRGKVSLDEETNRVWKLLMLKDSIDEDEDLDTNKEKWWEEERRVFRGRADSFIARMHLVQGDRRFSRWKGSVVDSVVGVFLTQNVSDHLSSSAFMALAARFPLRQKGENRKHNVERISNCAELQGGSALSVENTINLQGNMLAQELFENGSMFISDAENNGATEMGSSNRSLRINDGDGMVCHPTDKDVSHESPDRRTDSQFPMTGSTSSAEVEDRRSLEDAVSSQNSVASSQNSSEYLIQTANQSRVDLESNTESDLVIDSMCNGMDSSTSFMELLKIAESNKFLQFQNQSNRRLQAPEYFGTADHTANTEARNRKTILDQFDNKKETHLSAMKFSGLQHADLDFMGAPWPPSTSYRLHTTTKPDEANGYAAREENISYLPSAVFAIPKPDDVHMDRKSNPSAENSTQAIGQQTPEITPVDDPCDSISNQSCEQLGIPQKRVRPQIPKQTSWKSPAENISCRHSLPAIEQMTSYQQQTTIYQQKDAANFSLESTQQTTDGQGKIQHAPPNSHNEATQNPELLEGDRSNSKSGVYTLQVPAKVPNNGSKANKEKVAPEKKNNFDWDSLRKQADVDGAKKERTQDTRDSVDWEAVRLAHVTEVSETIRERGMNNMLAERIKAFLDRLVKDHGSVDLEWLRDVPPDKAKDYLLSIRGLGLKSVECVRLLTLHHLAFPVDTNVGRICVRLGWVPLQPLPESLQLHLLELYPMLETIQKFLWPRLCKLDQRTLYELHYQMITFGKVFCTKSKPNCNACPMRGECKHFASAFASARLALPGPEEKSLVTSASPIPSANQQKPDYHPLALSQLQGSTIFLEGTIPKRSEPIIEEPATPEPECIETLETDIEDAFYEDQDEIPTIKLNIEEFAQNLHNYMHANNMELQDGDMSKALVAISPEAASIPMPKLKNVSRLRTEHQVYELPDSHPLLEGLDQREPDDPCSYLLAIWTPGETAQSTEAPEICCDSQETGILCNKLTCFACNSIREAETQIVRGTLLIPCRTAMRGSFPLNGTYFQVNEVFADHDSSHNPINVPRKLLWNLPRRTVYFGTSIPTIFKGLPTEGIQHCFWKGFVCVRGFDRTRRSPRPLYARLHFPASKAPRNKKTEAPRDKKTEANKEK